MNELFVAAGPGEWRAAWVENGEIIELNVERGDTKAPGSVHLGRVVRLVPGLDAALIDIGDERPGLLPLREFSDQRTPAEGERIIVQVRREAWAEKAARLTIRFRAGEPPPSSPETKAPAQLLPPPGFAAALALRLPGKPQRIVCDDPAAVAELRVAFTEVDVLREAADDRPFDFDAAFEAALASTVPLAGGGWVHIETTRTATLIDVDTGTPERGGSARAVLAANRVAAAAIARQIRLRNLSGPMVVDFAGMERRDHREQVQRTLAAALESDPARPEVLGWTRLGHLELVRRRRARSLAEAMLMPGSPAKTPLTLALEALRLAQREARAQPAGRWRLAAAPEIVAALGAAAAPARLALEARLGRTIEIAAEPGRNGFDIEAI